MPELPDVETFRRYFNRTSLHKKIERIDIGTKEMLKGISSLSLQQNLKNLKFKKTSRHAKYLFAQTDKGKILVLHFGMTGSLKYYKKDEERPAHIRMRIDFANGYHLAFNCPRKLGSIYLINDREKFIENKNLGPDPVEDDFSLSGFRKIIEGKRGTIKSTLMDQKTISGIGNIFSDEILFNAGIHPATGTEKLNDAQVKKIYQMIKEVLNKVIDIQADPEKIPATYLYSHRAPGEDCPMCKGKIRKKTIGGRSSYFCDRHQRKVT